MTRGILGKAEVTGIAFLDDREIKTSIIDISNEMQFSDIMALGGRYSKTKMPSYHQFIDEDLFAICVIDAVTGSGTATLSVTLTAAGGTGTVRSGDKLKFSNDKVGIISSAITTASSKDSFTVKSVDGTNLTAAAADKMSVIGTTVGQASTGVTNINYAVSKEFNLIEAMRETDQITDIQNASVVTVEINGQPKYSFYQAIKKAQSFKTRISSTLIAGNKSVNEFGTASPTLTDAQGNSTQTTGGLYQETSTKGVNTALATLGTVVLADLDTTCDALNAVKAPSDYLFLCPDKAKRAYSKFTKALGSSGVTSAKLEFDGNEVGRFNYNVDQITYGKYVLQFGKLDLLDHPQLFAFSGSSSAGKAVYGIPKGSVNTIGSGVQPRIQIRYMDHGFKSGTTQIAEWRTGGMADTPTDDSATKKCHWLTYQGLECAGTKQFLLQSALS
jgi:hypothetical protein